MNALRAEIIAVGSELLEPWRADTNGAYLSRRLGERGVGVRFRTTVGDTREDLKGVFRVALERSDLIIATGGLGPTIDDLTRESVAELLDLPLLLDERIARSIEERFRRLALPMPPQNRRQAMVPRGAEVLPNRLGTAPGLWIGSGRATIVLLPGVPDEMRQIVEDSVLPRLPGNVRPRVVSISGPASPRKIVPGGRSGPPPSGPAYPVADTAQVVPKTRRAPRAISAAVSALTGPRVSRVSCRTPRRSFLTASE